MPSTTQVIIYETGQGRLPGEPMWQRISAAKRTFGISTGTLYKWINAGIIKSKKINRTRLVDVSSINEDAA